MMASTNLNSLLLRHLFNSARLGSSRACIPSSRLTNYSTQAAEEIVIPKRIPRGPTDILEALPSTVKRDHTAAHYKFHDDPFLIPSSNTSKRSFALAKEAGRKAAMWIKEQHGELFQHRNAAPYIEAFAPPPKLTDATPMTEEMLKKYIGSCQVSHAIKVYEKLENVTPEVKQSFLELLCFYNETDQLSEDLIEERWFRAGMVPRGYERNRKTWKDNGLAERVFNSMEPKTAEAYCALVCGMANYGQVEGAWVYYQQMQSEGFVPSLATFNSIIKAGGSLKESADLKWNFIQEILTSMIAAKVKPTTLTLNAILEAISTMAITRTARDISSRVMAEFNTLGVQPSLASYYFMLRIFCKEKGPVSNILVDIIERLEKEIPPLQDVQDVAFFSQAMMVCNSHLHDVNLARRLDRLLNSGPDTLKLIGDSFKESIYYRNFLQLVCRSETPDVVMETYRRLVPNIYTPELSVFEDLLVTMKECSAAHYAPELWTDAVYMDLSDRETIVELMLETLASTGKNTQLKNEEEEVNPIFATTKAIYAHVEQRLKSAQETGRESRLQWTSLMLDNFIRLGLQYEDVTFAYAVMTKANDNKQLMQGFIKPSTLDLLLDKCIQRGDSAVALMTVDYAAYLGMEEAELMGKKVSSSESLKLDERQTSTLKTILGKLPSPSPNKRPDPE